MGRFVSAVGLLLAISFVGAMLYFGLRREWGAVQAIATVLVWVELVSLTDHAKGQGRRPWWNRE